LTMDGGERRQRLQAVASEIRQSVVRMIGRARAGHIGGDLSVSDILATLFFGVLRVDPRAPNDPRRDRFILSKGHCAAALYSTLALRGFFLTDSLATFAADVGPQRAPEPQENAWGRGKHRSARPWASDRRRERDRVPPFRLKLADLCRAG